MRGFLVRFVGVCLFCAPAVLSADVAQRLPPSRAVHENTVNIGGIEYLPVSDFARRFGFAESWIDSRKKLVLLRPNARVELEIDGRETMVNGLRVFMGEPAREYRHEIFISRIDADHYLGPMLENPAAHSPIRVIALDAGHGGKDKGKINDRLGVNEKTMTLDVVGRLKKILEAAGYRVVLTRTEDRYVELEDRPAIAEREHADLFVSIHFNSVETRADQVTGVEVFSLTPQYQFSTDDNRHEAKDEAAVFNPGNRNDAQNARLAYEVHRALVNDLKVADRGQKRQRFKVLRLALCPAILIEGGYLSNDAEARKIMNPAYREELAQAVARGVTHYANLVNGEANHH